jgi:type I restriction enzyme S subunit
MNTPSDWAVKQLDEIGTIFSGSTPSTSIKAFWDGDVVWVTPNDLSKLNTPYLNDSAKRITQKGLAGCSAQLLPAWSIVMSSRAPIGYVAIPTVEFCTNQGCKSICLKDSFDTEFIYYNILFNIVKVKNLGEGTTFAEISKTALSAVTLAFPTSKPEQAKIAEVLSTVDRAIAQTEALIAKQQRIKAGLMHDLLTRGIDEHGTLRSEETHAFKDSPLGRIPAAWGVKRLDSVATFVTSGARGWARYYSKEGAIFIRIGNLTREHINLRLDDLVFVQPPEQAEGKRTSVAEGDILISITADLGITGVVPRGFGEAYVNQHIALVRLNRENICPRFMGWFLSSRKGQEQFEHLNESGAKAGLNLPTVRSLVLPYPSLDEQQMIASLVDASVKAYNEYLNMQQKLRALKTALMQDLLTGTRRVTALLEPEEASV